VRALSRRAAEPSRVPRSEIHRFRTIVQRFCAKDHAGTSQFWPFSFRESVPWLFNCVPRPVRGAGYGQNGRGRQNGRVVACNLNSAV
jgi:hypothetical protein